MTNKFDYWGLLAGIALFLFAMAQLEAGLKVLGGRSLAVYLRQRAGKRFNAILGGIAGTAFLQSSSVVGLMVLAFTGAGLLNLTSALGIVFGSNQGQTLKLICDLRHDLLNDRYSHR
jgi:phosphate:Na+ symporter